MHITFMAFMTLEEIIMSVLTVNRFIMKLGQPHSQYNNHQNELFQPSLIGLSYAPTTQKINNGI